MYVHWFVEIAKWAAMAGFVLPGTTTCSYLKQGHHQVSHTQIDHEHMHWCIILPPPQQHPQDKAIPQSGDSQHQPEHCDLCPGQTQVPHPGLGQGVRSDGRTILREDPKEGSPTERTIGRVSSSDKHRRGGEVVPSWGYQRGGGYPIPVHFHTEAFHSCKTTMAIRSALMPCKQHESGVKLVQSHKIVYDQILQIYKAPHPPPPQGETNHRGCFVSLVSFFKL